MASAAKPPRLLLDADVLINWLAQETDPVTAQPLWKAPYTLIQRAERGTLRANMALTTLLELRFVLRRKKAVSPEVIERILEDMARFMDVYLPDEVALLKANQLQITHALDPFDAILLAACLSLAPDALISRDKALLAIAAHVVPPSTIPCAPEAFVTP